MAFEYLEDIGRTIDSLKGQQTELQNVIGSFVEDTIMQARENLLDNPAHEATGNLAQSIEPQFTIEDSVYTVDILAASYWDFINSGVNGVQNNFGAPYSFKTIFPSEEMIDAFTGRGTELEGWMRAKNITELVYFDNNKEDFVRKELITDSDFESAAFVLARAVKKKGILPNHFMDRAFNEETLKRFDELILDAIEKLL